MAVTLRPGGTHAIDAATSGGVAGFRGRPGARSRFGHWRHRGRSILCLVEERAAPRASGDTGAAMLAVVADRLAEPLSRTLAVCDAKLPSSVTAAIGIAIVDAWSGCLTYAGVGGLDGYLFRGRGVRLRSGPGMLGAAPARHVEHRLAIRRGDTLAICAGVSDVEVERALSSAPGAVDTALERLVVHRADGAGGLLVYRHGETVAGCGSAWTNV